jgi:hypothetical protein
MKTKKEISYSLQLLMQLQKLSARKRESGFALLMASVMAILIFSMLTVYLFSSRLSRSTANAMIDAGSTFYAAESELNRRANDVRSRIGNFSRPSGVEPLDNSPPGSALGVRIAAMMQSCINNTAGGTGTGDFACQQNDSNYSESVVTGTQDTGISSGLRTDTNIRYRTFSFVRELPPPGGGTPQLTIIPPNNAFAGLRATDYLYRVYSTALKQADGSANVAAQSMLQMQFTDRFIPIFQFAAFYDGDLEVFPGAPMTVDGPVHSNRSIFLAPSFLLELRGNLTYVDSVNRSLPYISPFINGGSGSVIRFTRGGGYTQAPADCDGVIRGCITGQGAFAPATFPIAIHPDDIARTNGAVARTGRLLLPPAGFLSKQIGTRPAGVYWTRADLRVDFDPRNTNPTFSITRMNQSTDPPTQIEAFSPEVISSLQKPVMLRLRPEIDADERTRRFSEVIRLCPKLDGTAGEPADLAAALPTIPSALTALTAAQKVDVVTALQRAIAQTAPTEASLAFTSLKTGITGELRRNFIAALPASLSTNTNIINAKPRDIAALETTGTSTASTEGGNNGSSGGCFLPAPMQILSSSTPGRVFDKKEGRDMWILQSNIKSLTAWNRDGVYGSSSSLLSARNKLFDRKPIASLATADQLPDNNNAVNVANANCDYDCLGLGAVDGVRTPGVTTTSEGGLVWHYSLINRTGVYGYPSNTDNGTRSNSLGTSQYGFAFLGGARLPGALTVVSDQAMYIQGDYNNPRKDPGNISAPDPLDNNAVLPNATRISGAGGRNPAEREKRPAAILGDSAILLSNSCSDTSFRINCLKTFTARVPTDPDAMPLATNTVVRAAVLSGTEATATVGGVLEGASGLNNHLGFRENWNNQTAKYRGSLVSKGIPTEFNGRFLAGCLFRRCTTGGYAGTYFFPPTRDFGFDTDFNNVDGLPPLTPNVNLLLQRVYKRDYDALNRS